MSILPTDKTPDNSEKSPIRRPHLARLSEPAHQAAPPGFEYNPSQKLC